MSAEAPRVVLEDLRNEAGVTQPITPHWFRHRFGLKAEEQLGDIALVQALMGHSSPAVTIIYAHINAARTAAAHRQLNLE